MNIFPVSLIRPLALLSFLWMALSGTAHAVAADAKLEIQLVWGTDQDSSPNAKHKPLDPALAKKLGMFKWKKYFTVTKQEVSASSNDGQKIRLSSHCEIEVKKLSDNRYQINVYGEGKHVRKITERITKEDALTIAGDDKNDCGWFILIREI